MRTRDDVLSALLCFGLEERPILLGVIRIAVLMNSRQFGYRHILPIRKRGEKLDREELRKKNEIGAFGLIEHATCMIGKFIEAPHRPDNELTCGN